MSTACNAASPQGRGGGARYAGIVLTVCMMALPTFWLGHARARAHTLTGPHHPLTPAARGPTVPSTWTSTATRHAGQSGTISLTATISSRPPPLTSTVMRACSTPRSGAESSQYGAAWLRILFRLTSTSQLVRWFEPMCGATERAWWGGAGCVEAPPATWQLRQRPPQASRGPSLLTGCAVRHATPACMPRSPALYATHDGCADATPTEDPTLQSSLANGVGIRVCIGGRSNDCKQTLPWALGIACMGRVLLPR